MRVGDVPVFMAFCFVRLGLGYEAEALNLIIQPSNDTLVEVGEAKNVSWTMDVFVYPSVSVYQPSDQVCRKVIRYRMEYFGVSRFLEFVPSEFFEWGREGYGCDAEPNTSAFVILFDRMRTAHSRPELGEMAFVLFFQGDSKCSAVPISSASANVPVGKKESKPIGFQFAVYVLKEVGVEGVCPIGFGVGSTRNSELYESAEDGPLADPVLAGDLGQCHSGSIVSNDDIQRKTYRFHRLYLACITGAIMTYCGLDESEFCITGALPSGIKREEMHRRIEAAGGTVKTSVGRGLSYLVMADPSSSSTKARKARELGVECISEEQLVAMMG